MVWVSVRSIRAGCMVLFCVGIILLCLGVYSVYHVLTVDLPSGYYSRLPFAAVGCIFFGLLVMFKTYPMFLPPKQKSSISSTVCSSCGAMIEEDAAFCSKCKRQIEEKAETP